MKAQAIIAVLFLVTSMALRGETPSERSKANASTLPKECAEAISPDTGTPVGFPWKGPLWWGVSARPAVAGQDVLALLWLYNPTDKPLDAMTCMDIEAFWLSAMDVFDAGGRRVPSLAEERQKTWLPVGAWTKRPELIMCLRNFPIAIPARTCLHGTFSKAEQDLSVDLRTYYTLPPGRYFVVPAQNGPDGAPARRTLVEPKNGLEVIVREK